VLVEAAAAGEDGGVKYEEGEQMGGVAAAELEPMHEDPMHAPLAEEAEAAAAALEELAQEAEEGIEPMSEEQPAHMGDATFVVEDGAMRLEPFEEVEAAVGEAAEAAEAAAAAEEEAVMAQLEHGEEERHVDDALEMTAEHVMEMQGDGASAELPSAVDTERMEMAEEGGEDESSVLEEQPLASERRGEAAVVVPDAVDEERLSLFEGEAAAAAEGLPEEHLPVEHIEEEAAAAAAAEVDGAAASLEEARGGLSAEGDAFESRDELADAEAAVVAEEGLPLQEVGEVGEVEEVQKAEEVNSWHEAAAGAVEEQDAGRVGEGEGLEGGKGAPEEGEGQPHAHEDEMTMAGNALEPEPEAAEAEVVEEEPGRFAAEGVADDGEEDETRARHMREAKAAAGAQVGSRTNISRCLRVRIDTSITG